jgi:hypothetical protein
MLKYSLLESSTGIIKLIYVNKSGKFKTALLEILPVTE